MYVYMYKPHNLIRFFWLFPFLFVTKWQQAGKTEKKVIQVWQHGARRAALPAVALFRKGNALKLIHIYEYMCMHIYLYIYVFIYIYTLI